MKSLKLLLCVALAAAAVVFVFKAAPARADEESDDTGTGDIYVAPLDEDGSDETLRDEAGSGFDNAGPFYIPEDAYNEGDQGDGTWSPDVPDVPEPTPVEEDDGE
jgi:hypothetical protein